MPSKSTRKIFHELQNLPREDPLTVLTAYTSTISKLDDDPYSLRIFLDYIELSNRHLYGDIDELGYVYWFMKSKLRVYKLYWLGYIRFEVHKRNKRFEDVHAKVMEWLRVKEFDGKEELVQSLVEEKNMIFDDSYISEEENKFNRLIFGALSDNKNDNKLYENKLNREYDNKFIKEYDNKLNTDYNNKFIIDKVSTNKVVTNNKDNLNSNNVDKIFTQTNNKIQTYELESNEINTNEVKNDGIKTNKVSADHARNEQNASSSYDLSYLTKRMKEISEHTETLAIKNRENSFEEQINTDLKMHGRGNVYPSGTEEEKPQFKNPICELSMVGLKSTLKIQEGREMGRTRDGGKGALDRTLQENTVNTLESGMVKKTVHEVLESGMVKKTGHEALDRTVMEDTVNILEFGMVKKTGHEALECTLLENTVNTLESGIVKKTGNGKLECTLLENTVNTLESGMVKKTGHGALECTLLENTVNTLESGMVKKTGHEAEAMTGNSEIFQNRRFFMFRNKEVLKISKIGSGGFSAVYKVLYENEIYAWKQMKIEDQEGLNKCLEEIAILKKLVDCSFIIRLVDYEILSESVNVILEFGEIDLQKLLNSRKLDGFYIKYLWKSILSILGFIHGKRIIHRDIKPANFVLVKGILKLIDFGISKRIRSDTTSVINIEKAGTLNYISPEQCVGGKISRSTDIWSAGCILYFMIYNRHIFLYKNIMDIIRHMAEQHPIEYKEADPLAIESMKMCLQYTPTARAKPLELLAHKYLN